jgi:protein-arginine kinase activator protein McsA
MSHERFIEQILAHLKKSPIFVASMKKALLSYMQDAAAEEKYETASEIRDLIKSLEKGFKDA